MNAWAVMPDPNIGIKATSEPGSKETSLAFLAGLSCTGMFVSQPVALSPHMQPTKA